MRVETLHTTILHWVKENGRQIEEASWDWNPIWQMLSSNQQILKKMLELPCCHDCKLNNLNLHYFVQILNSLIHYYIFCLFAKGQTKNLKGLRSKNKKPKGFVKQK